MRALRRSLLLLALASAIPAMAPTVAAAPEADTDLVKKARAAFERGAALAADARWGDALAKFQQSAAFVPHATTTYNIGYCERALGRATRAKRSFNRALAQDQAHGGTELAADLREASKKFVVEMQARIATPTITLSPASATITVDGAPLEAADDGKLMFAGTRSPGAGERLPAGVGPTFKLEVDAGSRVFLVVAPDGRSKTVSEVFTPGDAREVVLDVPPEVVDPALAAASTRRTVGYVVGGAGLVSLGVGTFFILSARSTWNDALDACPARTTCPTEQGSTLSTRAKLQANVATIAFAVGGAALVSGVILTLTSLGKSKEATVSLEGGVGAQGGWVWLKGAF